jgi:hypothetical protein
MLTLNIEIQIAPSPFPSPRWGEGGDEGKISNIFA